MRTLVQGGTIVTSAEEYKADILIDGEKISAIGLNLADRAEKIIDASGKYIFPGGIDGHTHFASPSMNTMAAGYETTPAAAVGGTTCIVSFVPQPRSMSLLDSMLKHRGESAEGKSAVDFGLHSMVQDSRESIFEEVPALVKAGIPTIKLFMAYKGSPHYSNDETIFRFLQKAKDAGVLTMVHAEHAEMISVLQKQCLAAGQTEPKYHAASRPPVAEAEATFRATQLAKAAGAPVFIVHVSCAEAMNAVRDQFNRGIPVFGETCPHYLILGVDNLAKPDFEGAKYVCSPALREPWHQDHLWAALQNGWLQIVGSDHCGYNFKRQKEMGRGDFTKIPNGCPSIENRLAILYTYGVLTGKLTRQRMVDVFATAVAKLYGFYPRKGSVVVGGDADLVVFDPQYSGKISAGTSLQGVDYNIYEGFEQKGRAEKVLLRGNLIVDDGQYVGRLGQGQFVPREPYGLAYSGRA